MHVTAGFGDPPVAHLALNTSRITTHLRCGREAHYRYILNWATDSVPTTALTVGTIWHGCLERLGTRQKTDDIVSWAQKSCTENALVAEADGKAHWAKDIRKFAEWVEYALPIYVATYKDSGLRVLAVEVPFWVAIDIDTWPAPLVLRGRIDAIAERYGELVNLEHKTLGERTDPAAYAAVKRHSVQAGLYHAALEFGDLTPVLGPEDAQRPVAGVVYDLARKAPYPLRPSKNGTVEERRAEWEKGLFVREFFHLSDDDIEAALHSAVFVAQQWGRPQPRNEWACMNNGKVACAMFDICHRDGDTTGLTHRDPDYVDAVPTMEEE